ncbi:MAG: NF038104 family lipoprotein [Rhodoferax sp.]
MKSKLARWVTSFGLVLMLQACAVVAIADAAVTVVATGVKITAKAVGAVADVLIPDGDDDE